MLRQIRSVMRSVASVRYMESHVLAGVMVALIVIPAMFKI